MRYLGPSIAIVALLVPIPGTLHAADGSSDTLSAFADAMISAVASGPQRCSSIPDEFERRFCAAVKGSSSKLKWEWDRGLEALSGTPPVEPVTDWHSGRGLHWRYYLVDEQPIVVQHNPKSKTLEILGSALPHCETGLPEGMITIMGGNEDATAPELTYALSFYWPFRAHKADQAGKVRLIGIVTAEGGVVDLCVDTLEPPIVDLEISAAKAVRTWKFTPAMSDGKPTQARVPFPFELRPEDAQKVRLPF
jgi:TonB family protein